MKHRPEVRGSKNCVDKSDVQAHGPLCPEGVGGYSRYGLLLPVRRSLSEFFAQSEFQIEEDGGPIRKGPRSRCFLSPPQAEARRGYALVRVRFVSGGPRPAHPTMVRLLSPSLRGVPSGDPIALSSGLTDGGIADYTPALGRS